MLMADILHSCADEGVAAAAVASIGGQFAAAIGAEASRADLSVGALTSSLVASFARGASERDWRDLAAAMAGADHPVLSGLQAMAEHSLRHSECATRAKPIRDPRPATLPEGCSLAAFMIG